LGFRIGISPNKMAIDYITSTNSSN